MKVFSKNNKPQTQKNTSRWTGLVRFVFFVAVIAIVLMPKGAVSADAESEMVFYVSPSGSDTNPGTEALPWKTLQYAAYKADPGETIYVRGGVYNEYVNFYESGTAAARINILAYPGETPILDGSNYSIPAFEWGVMLAVSGDYVTVSGFEVRYSSGMGVALSGKYDSAEAINVHHNWQNGILILGDNGTANNNRVWSNCMSNENGTASSWPSGLSAARHPNNAVITNNVVYGNWGEGLSTYEANGTLIEGNIIYDNWSANLYVSDATNVVVKRNFVYATGAMTGGSQVGIMMGDEVYAPASANIQVVNNIVYGTNRTYYWWQGVQGGGMVNVTIANNTFVNSRSIVGFQINDGAHQDVNIHNNIIVQEGNLPIAYIADHAQLDFSNNLWSKAQPSSATGAGDVVGNPLFTRSGTPYEAGWFSLTAGSPAINRAMALVEASQDYFGDVRDQLPDIGADEVEQAASSLPNMVYLPSVISSN